MIVIRKTIKYNKIPIINDSNKEYYPQTKVHKIETKIQKIQLNYKATTNHDGEKTLKNHLTNQPTGRTTPKNDQKRGYQRRFPRGGRPQTRSKKGTFLTPNWQGTPGSF
jgi:hypothetical protein